MKKKDLLNAIESAKQKIENGKITNLLIAGCNEKGDTTSNICSTGIVALGLAEYLKMDIKKEAINHSEQQDFEDFLSMLSSDD